MVKLSQHGTRADDIIAIAKTNISIAPNSGSCLLLWCSYCSRGGITHIFHLPYNVFNISLLICLLNDNETQDLCIRNKVAYALCY